MHSRAVHLFVTACVRGLSANWVMLNTAGLKLMCKVSSPYMHAWVCSMQSPVDEDVVQKSRFSSIWCTPRWQMLLFMLQDAIPDQQSICDSKCQELNIVEVYFAYTISSKHLFPTIAIPANASVKVSSKRYHTSFWGPIQ